MPKVTLLTYTPDPEITIASAAKLCYSPASIDNVREGLDEQKASDFVDMLSSLGHESPTEHAYFTFGIEGVSRALLAQITRHRIASFSVQSQRYVTEKQFGYVLPPEIEKCPEALEIFKESMKRDQEDYDKITAVLKDKHLKEMLKDGMSEKAADRAAEKKAIEDARFVLPNACETKMIVTMNTRSLLNFFHHRCCNRAQWEIRDVANQMLSLVYGVAPTLFKKAGAPCVSGRCPEGKMSCGKANEIKELTEKIKNGEK